MRRLSLSRPFIILFVLSCAAATHSDRARHTQAAGRSFAGIPLAASKPFCPAGKSGLFVLYYGLLVDPLDEEEARVRERIRKARPNFLVVADVYYNNPRVPDFFHSDDSGPTSIRVLAYVATGGGSVNVNRIISRIGDAMAAGYDGIFFDEVSNDTSQGVVKFYSTIAQEVRRFGADNLVVFNPGTHTVNGGLFDQADIVSVENNTDDPSASKPSAFTSAPRVNPPAKGKIEAWRWLAVQGHPARLAAHSAPEALKRLNDFRSAGGFWYYSPHNAPKGKPPTGQNSESTHPQLPDWFEEFAAAVDKKGGPPCPP